MIPNTQLQPKTVSVAANWAAQAPSGQPGVNQDAPVEICFRPDPTIYDGRFANNGWLQELPKPITKLTWDNAVVISPATAASRGLESNVGSYGGLIEADQIVMSFKDRSILAPILIMPGHADGCATVYLGYGRKSAGRVGSNQGYNAYAIRTTDAQWSGPGLQISKTGDKVDLAVTQLQHMIDTEELRDRDLVRSGKINDYKHDPTLYPAHGHGTPEKHEGEHTPSLYPEYEYTGYKWGMTIRHQRVCGLQRLRRLLPGGKQHSCRRQRAGLARPRDALAEG